MIKSLILLIIFALLIPALAFANDNDDNDADYPCQEICDLASQCNTSCIPDDCYSFCSKTQSSEAADCAFLDECTDFNNCICSVFKVIDDDSCGGCEVSKRNSSALLTLVMLGIGLFAFFLSIKAAKRG